MAYSKEEQAKYNKTYCEENSARIAAEYKAADAKLQKVREDFTKNLAEGHLAWAKRHKWKLKLKTV